MLPSLVSLSLFQFLSLTNGGLAGLISLEEGALAAAINGANARAVREIFPLPPSLFPATKCHSAGQADTGALSSASTAQVPILISLMRA